MRFDPYAADPDAYDHVFRLARHLAGRPLDPAIRSLVELRASQINGCAFCLELHSSTARRAEIAQRKLDLLAGWREATEFSSRERAALALAEEMVRIGDGDRVSDETWARVRTEFDDDEISGLLYTIGLIRFLEHPQRGRRIPGWGAAAESWIVESQTGSVDNPWVGSGAPYRSLPGEGHAHRLPVRSF